MRKSSVDVFRRFWSAQALPAAEQPSIPKTVITISQQTAVNRSREKKEDSMSDIENFTPVGQSGPHLNGESLDHNRILVEHILAPTDLSDESRKTLDYAVRLAEHFHAKLTLVHVWTTPRSHTGVLGALDPEAVQRSKDRAEFILRGLQDIIRERHFDTESYFLIGNPCTQILAVAESSQVDLIVISARDYDWFTRVVEVSDAEQILRHATCPVWIVRNVVNNTATPRADVK